MSGTLRAAAVQFEHRPGAKQANLATVDRFLVKAAEQKVQILLFPECCLTGYWVLRHLSKEELISLAEPVFDGATSQALTLRARDNGMIIGAGLVEIDERGPEPRMYNPYVVALPDGKVYKHRKLHCFISEHLDSGDEFTVFDTPWGIKAGVLTCYDNNLGENVRVTALKGARILLAPHQTGGCGGINPHTMGLVDRKLWDNRSKDPEAIEEEFDKTWDELFDKPRVKVVKSMLWRLLVPSNPDLTLEQVGKLVTARELNTVVKLITSMING